MKRLKTTLLVMVLLFCWEHITAQETANLEKELQTQMIMAEDGATIEVPAGTFQIQRTLWLDQKQNITIKGAGMDQTILSFAGQIDGAEGIKVTNGTNIIIEDLTVQDSKGDGIKVQDTRGIVFRRVKAEWTGKPGKKNGAYGLYPVLCEQVLIEACEAKGASDAGIYVGQSKQIIVRDSKATYNVAGIEIENSLHADVYNNVVTNNTGGILVFDLPDLVQKKGGHVRVYQNEVRENNYKNFAPKGNIVGKVPPGSGVVILATNNVEIFENKIINNKTANTSIISYYMTEEPITDTVYYPYPTSIYIHDNEYKREAVRPTMQGRMGKLFRFKLKFGKDVPHIIYDGIVDDKMANQKGQMTESNRICIRNNQEQTFANIDAANGFKDISNDLGPYDCTLAEIPPTKLSVLDQQ